MRAKLKNMCMIIKEVILRKYQEKWFGKTVLTIILSLLGVIILSILTLYRNFDFANMWKVIIESLNSGSLFIMSLSLLSSLYRDRKDTADTNKRIIGCLNWVAAILIILIAMLYGASYGGTGDEIRLYGYQIFVSLVLYGITIIIILCFNFLNRTDALDDAVTNNNEDELILASKSKESSEGKLKI